VPKHLADLGLPGFYPAVAPPLIYETGEPLSDLALLTKPEP